MYQLLKGADDLAAVRQRYGAAGQKVINAYLANKLKPRGVILVRMDAELNKQINLLGESRREFTYVGPSKVYKFDVIPEPSMDRIGHLEKFETALQDHPDFRGWQGSVQSGGTYHINVPKLLKTITGLWRGRCWKTLADGGKIRFRQVMKLKRNETGYFGTRKSPSQDGKRWISSTLEKLKIDRRSKTIAYTYRGEKGNSITVVGKFSEDYYQIKFKNNSINVKCRTRKRL